MGKIKTKSIKRNGKNLANQEIEFTDNFETNKEILGGTMPSKKIRNQMAGYLVRLKRQEREKKEAQEVDLL